MDFFFSMTHMWNIPLKNHRFSEHGFFTASLARLAYEKTVALL